MGAEKPVILTVEDDWDGYSPYYGEWLDIHTTGLVARSEAEARRYFAARGREIALISVNAYTPERQPNYLPFVRDVRTAGFTGPIIAVTCDVQYGISLAEEGCDFYCGKLTLETRIQQILTGA